MEVWWNKSPFKTRHNPEIARIINLSANPLLLSDASVERVLSLCYRLQDHVTLQLISPQQAIQIDSHPGDIFLYQPSSQLQEAVVMKVDRQVIPTDNNWLWQVANNDASR
jgi:hypothetical protein